MKITAALVLGLILFAADSATAQQKEATSNVVAKAEVGWDHATDAVQQSHTATLKGVVAEVRFKTNWMVSGRFLGGALTGSPDPYYTGRDRDVAIRLEHSIGGQGWGHVGYMRVSASTDQIQSVSVFKQTFSPSDGSLASTIVGSAIAEQKGTTSYEGFEVGFQGRGEHGRMFFQAGAEFYPRLTFLSDYATFTNGQQIESDKFGGHAVGFRFEGSVGVRVWQGMGIEGFARSFQANGPDITPDFSRYANRLSAGFRVVYNSKYDK